MLYDFCVLDVKKASQYLKNFVFLHRNFAREH